ncbi:hypothetical protein KI387_039577, partial [Taxus chinensis]
RDHAQTQSQGYLTQRDQARAQVQVITIERDREAAALRQAQADIGSLTGQRDVSLQVALTSGDADLIRDAMRSGGEA